MVTHLYVNSPYPLELAWCSGRTTISASCNWRWRHAYNVLFHSSHVRREYVSALFIRDETRQRSPVWSNTRRSTVSASRQFSEFQSRLAVLMKVRNSPVKIAGSSRRRARAIRRCNAGRSAATSPTASTRRVQHAARDPPADGHRPGSSAGGKARRHGCGCVRARSRGLVDMS